VLRAAYVVANLAINAAAPVLQSLRRDHHSLGMDGDTDAVLETLGRFAPALRAADLTPRDRRVVELGPGRTAGVAAAMALAGATDVTGLDLVVRVPSDWTDELDRLDQGLLNVAAAEVRLALGLKAEDPGRGVSAATIMSRVRFERYDGVHLPFENASRDLVLSKSVLEHVHPDHVDGLLAELRRVIAPEGVMVHIIDLRDHMHILGEREAKGDWLDALRYPEPLFRAMFSNRPTLINRMRSSEWRAAFEHAHFNVERWDEQRFPLPDGFDAGRLAERWRGLDATELSVAYVVATLRPG
jgi:SAM-dependent methyltransferase